MVDEKASPAASASADRYQLWKNDEAHTPIVCDDKGWEKIYKKLLRNDSILQPTLFIFILSYHIK